jgi:SAM-dependent methyltransferase
MNFKLLFPTYRTRYCFVRDNLRSYSAQKKFAHCLHLGCGEGDYDPMIAPFCEQLLSADVNQAEVNFARELNRDLSNVLYQVENALHLSLPPNSLDLLISCEVIEHTGDPERMMAEIARVLRPGGIAIITFPSLDFPFTYDPINRALAFFGTKIKGLGAYAFGHWYLVPPKGLKKWAAQNRLAVIEERYLTSYFSAIFEMYWSCVAQAIFKANSENSAGREAKPFQLRPSRGAPALVLLTDLIIGIDRLLFGWSKTSFNGGFVLRKMESDL